MNAPLRWLDSLQGSGIRPGLTRMRALLRAAGHPERSCPSIIVAGTNGKGSTAATLASILHEAGCRPGLYTSPHLVDLRERWRIDETDVDEAALVSAIGELREAGERAGIVPTYFEALTAIAFLIFRAAGCGVGVLEVGLGGRLDATNVTRPLAAAITAIGFDHMEYLGNTIRSIAREKAGVIHRGCEALTSNVDEAILAAIERRCRSVGAPLHVVPREVRAGRARMEEGRLRFSLETPDGRYRLDSPLTGLHQVENVALAVRTAERVAGRFGVARKHIERGVARTRWRGRLERFEVAGKSLLVDGAHNSHAAARLAAYVASDVPAPRLLVFGIMKDKDVREVTELLFPLFDRIVVTEPDPQRTAFLEELRELAEARGIPVTAIRQPRRALAAALRGPLDSIVVAGSLYLAGAAIEYLDEVETKNQKPETKRARASR